MLRNALFANKNSMTTVWTKPKKLKNLKNHRDRVTLLINIARCRLKVDKARV